MILKCPWYKQYRIVASKGTICDPRGQELYFMARLLRGTIHQQGQGHQLLDDETVEKMTPGPLELRCF